MILTCRNKHIRFTETENSNYLNSPLNAGSVRVFNSNEIENLIQTKLNRYKLHQSVRFKY